MDDGDDDDGLSACEQNDATGSLNTSRWTNTIIGSCKSYRDNYAPSAATAMQRGPAMVVCQASSIDRLSSRHAITATTVMPASTARAAHATAHDLEHLLYPHTRIIILKSLSVDATPS